MEALLYYIIVGAVYFFALAVQRKMKSTYSRWSRVQNQANMTGAQTAQAILQANRMGRVKVGRKPGKLTDYYNPRDKTIGLSEQIYGVSSVAAMAIAAHESGHAIQDEVDYVPLEIRTFLAPIAAAGAKFGLPAAIFGSFLGSPLLLQAGVIAYGGALLLQFLTLPVELNASKLAMRQLEQLRLMDEQEKKGVKEVLRAAAMTHVAGAASSAGYIIYIAIIAGRWIFRKPPLPTHPMKPPPLP